MQSEQLVIRVPSLRKWSGQFYRQMRGGQPPHLTAAKVCRTLLSSWERVGGLPEILPLFTGSRAQLAKKQRSPPPQLLVLGIPCFRCVRFNFVLSLTNVVLEFISSSRASCSPAGAPVVGGSFQTHPRHDPTKARTMSSPEPHPNPNPNPPQKKGVPPEPAPEPDRSIVDEADRKWRPVP